MLFILSIIFYFANSKQMSNHKPSNEPTSSPEINLNSGAIEHQKRKIIDPITNNNIPHENLFDIDAKKAELDCDAKPMHEQRQNPPPVQPANGNPIPNDEQQNAVRPASFNSDLQKLIMMGYSPEKAKNALLAADFNLLLAIKKLQGL